MTYEIGEVDVVEEYKPEWVLKTLNHDHPSVLQFSSPSPLISQGISQLSS